MKAYLHLSNGMIFEGERHGASGDAVGELVFTTNSCGYLETLSDPSYYGQIVLQTFPLIGNYGTIKEDFESERPALTAYIVRELCADPSNFRSEGLLKDYLKEAGVAVLTDVDTRAITRIVRENGVMNAIITDRPELSAQQREKLHAYIIKDAVASVTCGEDKVAGEGRRVVLWDFGAKRNIRRELIKRGCEVVTVSGNVTAEHILSLKPQGLMYTNGPGDPAENVEIIAQMKKLLGSGLPTMGVCLGHQLMALAAGGKTAKMKYGHRGANQPVVDTVTGRVYITSQNHGYAVLDDALPTGALVRYQNANDHTCEGVDYPMYNAFTVQFHPEAASGPQDCAFLFDRFMAMMEGREYAAE